MKCVVLAAGYATRLYPLTKSFPKPLLDVMGKSILDWLLDDIDACGHVDGYVIVSNHVYRDKFDDWAKNKALKAPITVVDDLSQSNETRLGAVKDMILAMECAGIDDDMLVIAGDNVLDFSLSLFLDYASRKPGSCAMRYFEPDENRLRRAGVVQIDSDDRMISMVEKPETPLSNWCVPPFYCYKKKDLPTLAKAVEEGCPFDAPGSALAWLGGRTDVYLMPMPGKRYDIGNLESYGQVKREYRGIL